MLLILISCLGRSAAPAAHVNPGPQRRCSFHGALPMCFEVCNHSPELRQDSRSFHVQHQLGPLLKPLMHMAPACMRCSRRECLTHRHLLHAVQHFQAIDDVAKDGVLACRPQRSSLSPLPSSQFIPSLIDNTCRQHRSRGSPPCSPKAEKPRRMQHCIRADVAYGERSHGLQQQGRAAGWPHHQAWGGPCR